MKKFACSITLLATVSLFLVARPVRADTIPYPDPGTIVPTNTFTATATGEIDAYFYGASASDTDFVELKDVTAGTSTGFIFDNQTTSVATEAVLAGVTAGDTLEFLLENTTSGNTFSSNPGDSADGINHAYATAYTATGSTAIAGIPAGTYIGMEDASDFDYNDDAFVFTNVSSAPSVPEPASVILLGAGLTFLGILRKRY